MPDNENYLAEESYVQGVKLRRNGEYQLALQCFLKADKFSSIKSPRAFHLLVATLENIGFLYYTIGLPYKAIQVLTRARLIYDCADFAMPECIGEIYRLLGAAYGVIGDYQFATLYLHKARMVAADRLEFRNEAIKTQKVHPDSADRDDHLPDPTRLSIAMSITANLVDLIVAMGAALGIKQSDAEPNHQYFSELRDELDQLCLEVNTALREMGDSALDGTLCKLALAKAPLLVSGFGVSELGLYDAISQLERSFGSTHPILFDWLVLAGRISIRLGYYDRAELMIDRAISIAKKSFGPHSGRLIECFALLLGCPDLSTNQGIISQCIQLSKIEIEANQIAYASHVVETARDLLSRAGTFGFLSDVTDERLNSYNDAISLLTPFLELESNEPLVPIDDCFPVHNQGWLAARKRWKSDNHQLYAFLARNMASGARLKQNYQAQELYLRQSIGIYKRLQSRASVRLSYLGYSSPANVQIVVDRLHLKLAECLHNQNKHTEADKAYADISEFAQDIEPADFELYDGYANYLRRTGQSRRASKLEDTMMRSLNWQEWQPSVPIKYQWRLLISAMKLHARRGSSQTR